MRALTHPLLLALALAAAGTAHADDGELPLEKELTDEDLAKLSEGEAIEIFDERPSKPFNRDTVVRLTGEELALRGATDLATALQLLPDVTVRDAGRGGFNIDIRGARKGAVAVMVDGVLVTDPWYGTFDVSTIPVTDIVQIRVSTTPMSPIDGPGGPGGVIEVLTRDAIGEQLVVARLTADSLPTVGATGTARVALAKKLALRLSGSGLGGARDMDTFGGNTIEENRRSATGAMRLEYRDGDRRVALDGFVDDRSYVPPPNEESQASYLIVDRETSARTQIKADEKFGKLQLQGNYFLHYLHRTSRRFSDAAFTNELAVEDLTAYRSGGLLLATRPFARDFRWATSVAAQHDKGLVVDQNNQARRGETTVINAAVDLQYARKRLTLDAAGGLAIPIGVGADPWPEAKIVARYQLSTHGELTATTGYKGRVPSLRERFEANGNASLGPEKALHGEVRYIEQRDRLRLEVAPYYRRTNGTIRMSQDPEQMGKLVNLGDVDIYGVDTQAKVRVHPIAELGGAYNFVIASDQGFLSVPAFADVPLDRLPRNRFDAWARFTPHRDWFGLVRGRWFGESVESGRLVSGYFLLEANVTAQLSKEYMAVLRVDDLLDRRPETRAGYFLPGRVISLVLQGTWQ